MWWFLRHLKIWPFKLQHWGFTGATAKNQPEMVALCPVFFWNYVQKVKVTGPNIGQPNWSVEMAFLSPSIFHDHTKFAEGSINPYGSELPLIPGSIFMVSKWRVGNCVYQRSVLNKKLSNLSVYQLLLQTVVNGIPILVGGLEHLDYFPFHIWDVILPIDFHMFQRGGSTTNQI